MSRSSNRAAFTLLEVFLVLVVLGLLALFLLPTHLHSHHKANSVKCGNNLGQIAKASFQYATDWHEYPHLAPAGVLDGDYRTDTSPRCMRALVWHTLLLDNTESFMCPSAPDQFVSMPETARCDGRTWIWGQIAPSATVLPSPIVRSSGDPTLARSTELSYGWTMTLVTGNSPSQTLLAGDKARLQGEKPGGEHTGNMIGNHKDYMLATTVDSHVFRATPLSPGVNTRNLGDVKTRTSEGGGLGVLNDEE